MKLLGLDTETMRGKAFLLSHASGVYIVRKWADFLTALHELKTENAKFVFYNLRYDAAALLRHCPARDWEKLYIEKKVFLPDCTITMFDGKFMEIRHGGEVFEMYDLFPFFQTSLDVALKDFGIKTRKRKFFVENGKRVYFKELIKNLTWPVYYRYEKQINDYAIADSAGLQILANQVAATLGKLDLDVTKLYSPGFVAKKYFASRGVDFGRLPSKYRAFVRGAYFGARIECVRRGTLKQVYEMDVKSSYPSVMAKLPDFANARYYFSKKIESPWYIVKAKVWMQPGKLLYPLPVREKNTIFFPRFNGESTHLTSLEFEVLRRDKSIRFKIEKVLNIEVGSGKPYRRVVQDLFKRRKLSGFDGKFFKLILNSAYGVTAESNSDYAKLSSISAAVTYARAITHTQFSRFYEMQCKRCKHARRYWERACNCGACNGLRRMMPQRPALSSEVENLRGRYYRRQVKPGRVQNLVVAAFITAGGRMKLWEVARRWPDKIISMFTDGIFSTDRLPVRYGHKLGDWESDGVPRRLTIVGCGVYEYGKKVKFRSFRTKMKLRELLAQTKSEFVRVPQFERQSGLQMARRKYDDTVEMNEIIETEKTMCVNFDTKRVWPQDFRHAPEVLRTNQLSRAYELTEL